MRWTTPAKGEIRVRMGASGLCHSDDHHATGDMKVGKLPFAGGHEGAGVVEAIGPHTGGFAEGDHVVFSFLPSCGRCRWCATGHQNLCDLGASIATNARWDDPTSFRPDLDGEPTGQMCGLSTFCEHTTVSRGVSGEDRSVDPAGGRLPDRLQRRYRLGRGPELRPSSPGSGRDRDGHRGDRDQPSNVPLAALAAVMEAARPIPPRDRDAFLRDVASELGKYQKIGSGLIGRVLFDSTARRY